MGNWEGALGNPVTKANLQGEFRALPGTLGYWEGTSGNPVTKASLRGENFEPKRVPTGEFTYFERH